MSWLDKLIGPKHTNPGAINDPRPQEEQDKDFKAEEIASFGPVTWREKDQSEWVKFPIRNQNGSSSCVLQGIAKVLGIENYLEEGVFIELSARDGYARRANFPGEGTYYMDGMNIARTKGLTLEEFMPSQNMSEAEMNNASDRKPSYEQVAQVFKGGNVVQPPLDIDSIASVLSEGKGIVLGFRFTFDEWTSRPRVISPLDKYSLPIGHCVAATPQNYFISAGEKCILIEDSWGQNTAIDGRRIITQDFINKRCVFAGYFLNLDNNWRDKGVEKAKPQVNIEFDLKFGDRNEDVKKLQQVLQYLELFPQNVEITGYYGAITARGVLAFQKKYKVDDPAVLDSLGGKVFGPKSRAVINLNRI